MLLRTAFLLVIAKVVISEELAVNITNAVLPEPKNAFKFEDQRDTSQSYGLIRFEENNAQKYGYHQNEENSSQRIKFGEEKRVENQRPSHQKKKRRRRRPKQVLNVQNGGVPGYPVPGPVFPGPIYPGQRPFPQPGYPYPGQFYKPQPSPTSAALSAVTEALTSIALYDDRQCVPRLLCEAAGGSGSGGAGSGETVATGGGGGGGLLQAVTGLQPLLTLLAAYNSISSSPLFVFGRAVFLGMTSKANPGTCRYAYPDCPNDPEQLIHYLNNHNGGFFRFFAAPELNQQQGVEQFYNQLSGQNYGYYQPQQNLPVGYGHLQQQNYQNPNLQQLDYGQLLQQGLNLNQQGLNQNQNLQQVGYGQHLQSNYQNSPYLDYQRPNLYGTNNYGFYGNGYPYQQKFNHDGFKSKEIQKRIQNSPNTVLSNSNNVGSTKWQFPEEGNVHNKYSYDNVRQGKVLKFPQSSFNSIKVADGFVFPGVQSNREYNINNIEAAHDNHFKFDNLMADNGLKFDNKYNYASNFNVNYYSNDEMIDDGRTLYIVRGNGDPNHPEVVYLAPGQTL